MAGPDAPDSEQSADIDVRIETTQFIIDEILRMLGDTWAENEELKQQLEQARLNEAPTPVDRIPRKTGLAKAPRRQGLPPHGILIIDDSKILQMRLRSIVEPLGYPVVGTANSGLQGLEKAISLNPQLIILDYHMPAMNGLECLKALRRQQTDVKVLVCAGEITQRMSEDLIKHGVDAMVTKPIELDRFIKAIRRLMSG
jgi:two-component system chemotaxis response regulator CheY